MTTQDAGYGRRPTLAQAVALAEERALADALAEALLGLLTIGDYTSAEVAEQGRIAAAQAVTRYLAVRGA